ncbi:hypothetical protein H9654_00805 [Stenotrophomonas sp. Sa5BUN4]|uniref:Transmembrane protein n=1 Tax=Stenotrophomonas lacuserhaii TaxID=2760084 RepID=A0A8X8FS33_9GAMM|nr:hypothetical protein [Stenotrophomonas pennii]MBD7952731.1 hypothetical protein [Stenotrophomonas pennii]
MYEAGAQFHQGETNQAAIINISPLHCCAPWDLNSEKCEANIVIPTHTTPSSRLARLFTLIGAMAALATIIGFVFHGCGHVEDVTYLRQWGIGDGVFERSADWKIVNGYYAVILQGLGVFSAIPWGLGAVVFVMLAVGFLLLRLPSREPPQWSTRCIAALPGWLKLISRSMALSAAAIYLMITVFTCVLLLSALPGIIGERSGKERAALHKAALQSVADDEFDELWEGGERIAYGVMIASSPTRYAIYDHNLKAVRVVSSSDVELRGRPKL